MFSGNTKFATPNSENPNAFLVILKRKHKKGYQNEQFSTVFIMFPECHFTLPQNDIS